MQKQLETFIQNLPQQLYIETIPYQTEQILDLFENFKKQYSDIFILEKNLQKTETSEDSYTVIAFKKILEIKYDHQQSILSSGYKQFTTLESPLVILKEVIGLYASQQKQLKEIHHFFPFLIGQTSYDFVAFTESACSKIRKGEFPALKACIYQHYLFFNHDRKIANFVSIEGSLSSRGLTAGSIAQLKERLDPAVKPRDDSRNTKQNAHNTQIIFSNDKISSDTSDQEFAAMIEVAKQHIVDGEVFQIVLSRNFYCSIEHSSFYVYQALRSLSDAPYLFYFNEDETEYLGASPEKLVSVKNKLVETCPLAGTRKRIHSPSEKFVEEELLSDEKETAEHMMLVDLARNDIGVIAKSGSVLVNKLKQLKKYSHVMHLSSSIQGILNEQFCSVDALKFCFPAGTLTGAPKIRAMQLIDQIEKTSRGFYGGTIFLMDLNQNLESCIAIRMAEISNNQVKIRSGAGIVYDSEIEKEILETKNKASLLLQAVFLSKEYGHAIANR